MTGALRFDAGGPKWVAVRVLDSSQPSYVGVSSFLREKALSCRDVAVYYSVIERTNWRTGTCDYTLAALADEIGLSPKYVINSISRLKQHKLLLNRVDAASGKRYIQVNPAGVWSGTGSKQADAHRSWAAAWKEEKPEEVKQAIDDYELQEIVDEHNRRIDARNRRRDAEMARVSERRVADHNLRLEAQQEVFELRAQVKQMQKVLSSADPSV